MPGKQDLDELETIATQLSTKLQEFIICKADRRAAREIQACIGAVRENKGWIRDADVKILYKAHTHAEYHREHGEVAYQVNNTFYSPDGLTRLIGQYSSEGFFKQGTRNLMESLQEKLHEYQILSAKEIATLEYWINRRHNAREGESLDRIEFDQSRGVPKLGRYGNMIVNFAQGRGRGTTRVSDDDVVAVKQRYTTEEGVVDLSELSPTLLDQTPEEKRGKMRRALQLAEAYLTAVDPETHNIQGMAFASRRI